MLVLVLAVMGSLNSGLKEAATALDDLQYEEALQKLPAESERRGATRAELIEWFSVRGLAQLGLKRDTDATQSFLRLFSFAPEWQVPEQYGPRVRTVVAAARAEAARNGVVTLQFEAGQLVSTKDPWGFATALEVSWRTAGGAPQTKRLSLEPRQPPPWPQNEKLEVWGRVLGLADSTLFEWGNEHAPLRLEPRDVMSVEREVKAPVLRPLGVVGLGLGAAAVVAGGLAVGLSVASQDAERALADVTRDANGRITSLSQRDAFALDARAKSSADAATAFTISAAVLLTAGAGLVLFDRLTATATPGGVGLSLALDANFGLVKASR